MIYENKLVNMIATKLLGASRSNLADMLGCSSVILLRPKIGLEPPKHDVISTQHSNIPVQITYH